MAFTSIRNINSTQVVNISESFAVADHLLLDYLINFLIQVEDFPRARLTSDIDVKYFINFSTTGDSAEARKKCTPLS